MKLTNNDLFVISSGLDELGQVKLDGLTALKVFRTKKKVVEALEPVIQAITKTEEKEERLKISKEEIELDIEPFDISIFENIEEIKAETLFKLEKLIKEANHGTK